MREILKKIVAEKKYEVRKAKIRLPLPELKKKIAARKNTLRCFLNRLSEKNKLKCIGELKVASPSRGYLNKNLNLAKAAKVYEKSGIDAISVLTDKHFKGKLKDLKTVRDAVKLPILRKDFIIESYQIYESLYAGADAVLLIAAILTKKKLAKMLKIVHKLKLEAIVEVHNAADISKIDFKQARIIGINNRNLNDFSVDLMTTRRLAKKIPAGKIVISESGIKTRADILRLIKLKVDAVLIGEGIVSSSNIAKRIKTLLGKK